MDKTNNLQYFLTDLADAIREKKGTSDLINAQNFADEIKNLSQSGEGGDAPSGGGSNIYVRFLIPENKGGSEVLGMCAGIPMGQIVCTYPDTQTLEYLPAVVVFADLFQSGGQGYDMLETTRAFSIISTDKVFIVDKSLPIKTFDDFVDALIYFLSKTIGSIGRDMISQWFAEMTEEEFYNLEA